MLNKNLGSMRLKYQISAAFFFIVLINHSVYGQAKRTKADSCSAKYEVIASEYRAGHFSTGDSLFARYKLTGCFNINKANQREIKNVLKIIIEQKKLDNYNIHQADSLQKELNAIYLQFPDSTNFKHYQLRFGPSGSVNFSKAGPAGWSGGFILGMDFPNEAGGVSPWGVDLGAFYQQMPFSIIFINNYSNYTGSFKNAWLLIANGHNTLSEFPVRISYKISGTSDGKFWGGIVAGAEFVHMRSESVNNYSYDWNYTIDTARYKVPNNTTFVLTYQSHNDQWIKQNAGTPFFSTQSYVNLIIGDNFYWRISDRLLFVFSPEYHQNVGNELAVNTLYTPSAYKQPVNSYSVRPDNFMLRVSLCYLLKKERNLNK